MLQLNQVLAGTPLQVKRDMVPSWGRGTIPVGKEKLFINLFSSLFAPKTFFVV